MEIVNDLHDRVRRALETGRTGDMEVIEFIAHRSRTDKTGFSEFSNEEILGAVLHQFEIRPSVDSAESKSSGTKGVA
jgi:hypothetical protein